MRGVELRQRPGLRRRPAGSLLALAAAVALAATAAGCLGPPTVDQRWTNLEFLRNSLSSDDSLGAGLDSAVTVDARITYRSLLTGFLVVELRASNTVNYDNVLLDFDQRKIGTAKDVDRILAGSVTAGRAIRSVTGYPQLMEDLHLSFGTHVPASVPDSTGALGAAPTSLFLVLYMGSGEEVRLEDGRDSVIITPFISTEKEILSKGIAIPLAGSTGSAP